MSIRSHLGFRIFYGRVLLMMSCLIWLDEGS